MRISKIAVLNCIKLREAFQLIKKLTKINKMAPILKRLIMREMIVKEYNKTN